MLRDLKIIAGILIGLSVGSFLGINLTIGFVSGAIMILDPWSGALGLTQDFGITVAIVMMVVGGLAGGYRGAYYAEAFIKQGTHGTTSPLSPEAEKTIRARFTPFAPPVTEDRIKQPDSPDTTEPPP